MESMLFDESTLADFANMYINKQISGFRVYLGKYQDAPGSTVHTFTMIVVGTRLDTPTGHYVDTIIPSPTHPNMALSIQDFGDPCLPTCSGTTLGGGKP